MKTIFLALGIFATSATFVRAQDEIPSINSNTAETLRDVELQKIKEISATFVKSWNRHDANLMRALFLSDAVFTNFIGIVWQGVQAIVEAHDQIHLKLFKNSVLRELETSVRFVRPDVATSRMKWHLEGGLDRATGQPSGPREGWLLFVLVQDQGVWRIHTAQNTDIKVLP